MGGAFVAVADDIHSCYWNPAGLGNLSTGEITVMKTMNNQDAFNYQKWLAAGLQIQGEGGIGVSYVHKVDWWFSIYDKTGKYSKSYLTDTEWIAFSIGGYGKGVFSNTAFGFSYREKTSELKSGNKTGLFLTGDPDFRMLGYKDKSRGMDFGLLHKIGKNFTLGVLVQDFNGSRMNFRKKLYVCENGHSFEENPGGICPIDQVTVKEQPTISSKHIRNIRPGIAWRPDKKTTVAVDIYNFTLDNAYDKGAEGQSKVRIGVERWCTDEVAIRAGFYGRSFHTIGIGLKGIPGFKDNEKVNYLFDYALLQDDDGGTHLVSFSAKF
jgi:hypothetical protein